MTVAELTALPTREALSSLLKSTLPLAPDDSAISDTRGGRRAALATLKLVQPKPYARSRNYLDGQVTRLSAYLRHGVLTLAEVRDHVLNVVSKQEHATKLVQELAWRDYWQRIYAQIGEGIWQDREPWKTGFQPADYKRDLPAKLIAGTTTLACMDAFSEDLRSQGYLHNHARMWMAAYVVHWLRLRWQAGAAWFLEHLIDGDPASNNLSWQWVASTFGSKPYFFNRENLQRYTNNTYCSRCIHAANRTCPFDAPYEALEQELFPRLNVVNESASKPAPAPRQQAAGASTDKAKPQGKALIWVHTDALNPAQPALQAPDANSICFIWDAHWLESAHISLKRAAFIAECLQELPAHTEIRSGSLAQELLQAAQAAGATHFLSQRPVDPALLAAAAEVSKKTPVIWLDVPAFVDASRGFELKRFSRYWQRAEASALRPTR